MRFPVLIFSMFSIALISCDSRKHGCTDPNSISYDPGAEVDDGSCSYPTSVKKVAFFFFTDSENSTSGSFGMPLFVNTINQHGSSIIPIALHAGSTDTLFCGEAVSIASVYNVSGYPDFCVGSSNNLLTQSSINNAIAQASGQPATGNVEANFSIVGDSIKITLYGKFFTSDTADYFAAAYMVEDDINLPQAGISDPNFRHQQVLRFASGTSGIGDQVSYDVVTSGTSFKKEYSVFKKPEWNLSNMRMIAILWKQTSSGFEFVNANDL